MNTKRNEELTGNSQRLCRRMTKEERHLWYDCLKNMPVTINRQKIVGRYIVDFYCASASVVIEIDGTQHYEAAGRENDTERDEYLNGLGIKVIRFSNHDINYDFESVCAQICEHLLKASP